MAADLPGYYFRLRENGALVFRVGAGNPQGRLELDPLAIVTLRNGDVKPQGERVLTAEDRAVIRDWVATRQAALAARGVEEARRTVEHLNLTAQWAQSRADAAELDAVCDDLLMAMHDLRAVLVRQRAARVPPGSAD